VIDKAIRFVEEVKRLMKNRIKEIEGSMTGKKEVNCLFLKQEIKILEK